MKTRDRITINNLDSFTDKELCAYMSPFVTSLSGTKKKVLKHLMSGQPMKNIPQSGVTYKYAEKLVIHMRNDLGGISTNELLYIMGMIKIHKYL